MRPGRRFKGDAGTEMPLIATIGAGMILQNGAALLFGNKATAFPIQLWSIVKVGGIFMTEGLIVSLFVALVLLVALELLVGYTDFGRQIRAVAQNRDAAQIMGIDANRVIVLTVAMSTLLAGVAGILVGLSYGVVSPLMGIPYAIKGLVAMIVGGVGSLRGAVLGAVLIGVAEALSTTWIGSASRDVSVFLILLLALLLRPKGIIRARGVV
jgi:branched-chain amino acid transport system permease protein